MDQTVAIIGAGSLGRWLAANAAYAGYRVLLEDVMPAHLHCARELLGRELMPRTQGCDSGAARSSVAFVSTIEEAVRDADLVIDCVPDELESKLEILWLLDRMAPPRTVLATPTTRLSIADLASCTYRPGQCVAIAAEASALTAGTGEMLLLRTCAQTTAATVALVADFCRRLGFIPSFEADPAQQP